MTTIEPATVATGLRTFRNIARLWVLSPDEQAALLGVPATVLEGWRDAPPTHLEAAVLERLSHVFGIYHALEVLIPDRDWRDQWIRQPNRNPLFGSRAPLERMMAEGGLEVTRRHLDGALGG
jgi:hypothetical protein